MRPLIEFRNDQIYIIADGKIIGSGTPQELRSGSTPMVRQFMHGMADGPVAFHFAAPNYAEQLLGRDGE